MGFPAHSAGKAIRGKVQDAVYTVTGPGIMGYTAALKTQDFPFQINNMAAWLTEIYTAERNRGNNDLVVAVLSNIHKIKYIVNYGAGAKTGRGSHLNVFEYEIGDTGWLVKLVISSVSHQHLYQQEVREGKRIRQPKLYYEKPRPYLHTSRSKFYAPQWVPERKGWEMKEMEPGDFFEKFGLVQMHKDYDVRGGD